jgi:hypothetical protein
MEEGHERELKTEILDKPEETHRGEKLKSSQDAKPNLHTP